MPRRLKVGLMLLAMVLIIGHDAFPHVHPHDHAWHHPHDHSVCESAEEGILDRLLTTHSLNDHSHAYAPTFTSQYAKQQTVAASPKTDRIAIGYPPAAVFRCQYFSLPKPHVEKVYLHSNGLRAPPVVSC
ncbi:hypothetical protein [Parapedobacter luteus]|uniref:hypothetical protein n=1 Tax=Parapedobacter luteus TaxID=623280 RepID=UPI001115E4CD|nr:hypothetical protein [Parapedobacter luteus]